MRPFALLLTILMTVAVPAGSVVAQTTQQQVQKNASDAASDATKAVDSANVQTQAAIAKPETHKKTIAIIAVVVLALLLVLFSAMRGRRKETIIQTRR